MSQNDSPQERPFIDTAPQALHESGDCLALEFCPSNAQRKKASQLLRKYRPRKVRRVLLISTAIALFLMVLCAMLAWGNYRRLTFWLGQDVFFSAILHQLLLFMALAVIVFFSLIIFQVNYSFANNFRSLQNRTFRYTLAPDGLESEDSSGRKTFFYWSAIENIVRDGENLLFFIDQAVALFIPVSCFANEADAQRYLQLAQQYKESA